MRRLLLALLLFSSPAYSKLTEEGAKKMGNTLLLNCKEYGMESCVSRIIGMSACTYVWSVNQGTEPKKAQGISDVLFTAMTNKHKIPFDFFFNPDDTMKVDIKRESIERIQRCESAIKEAMPVIYEAFNDKPLEKDKVDEVAKAYPFWYVSDLERMKRKYY